MKYTGQDLQFDALAPATFHYWKKKLANKSGRKDFIPLIVKPSGVDLAKGATCPEKNPDKKVNPLPPVKHKRESWLKTQKKIS